MPGEHPPAQRLCDRLGQAARPAEDRPREALAAIPDELEVADPVAGRHLLGLSGRAPDRRAKDGVYGGAHRAEKLREGRVVSEGEYPGAPVGFGLAGP